MKKEILAISMLVAMLFASVLNILYLKNLTDEIVSLVEESASACYDENWDLAEICADQAKNAWNRNESYTHIVLRHSEIDTVSDALYDYMSGVYERNPDAVKTEAEKVIYHLDSIYKMEQVRFGTIF